MNRLTLVAAALTLWGASDAMAHQLCEGGPKADWIDGPAVEEILHGVGYSGDIVLAIEDGCIEAKVVHAGKRFEVYIEPVTGEIVLEKTD